MVAPRAALHVRKLALPLFPEKKSGFSLLLESRGQAGTQV